MGSSALSQLLVKDHLLTLWTWLCAFLNLLATAGKLQSKPRAWNKQPQVRLGSSAAASHNYYLEATSDAALICRLLPPSENVSALRSTESLIYFPLFGYSAAAQEINSFIYLFFYFAIYHRLTWKFSITAVTDGWAAGGDVPKLLDHLLFVLRPKLQGGKIWSVQERHSSRKRLFSKFLYAHLSSTWQLKPESSLTRQ